MLSKSRIHVVLLIVASTTFVIGCHSGGGRFARNDSTSSLARSGCSSGACGGGPALAHSSGPSYAAPSRLELKPNSRAAVATQRTCPVTGEELGSMGSAIPVKVKGKTVLVCCQGCVKKVQQNPDKYLAKVHAETRAGS